MHDHAHGADSTSGQWIVLLPFVAAAVIYVAAALAESRKGRPWPWWRTSLWLLGLGVAALVMSGVELSGSDRPFTGHAVAHVLIGMVAPLSLVLAAPVTLALRSFAVLPARRLSRALRSIPVRILGHPIIAALLNVGGLWMLYLTPLYENASDSFLHLALLVHFLATGVLFTAAVLPVDPSPHRAPVALRLVVLTLSLAAHGVLAKALYASTSDGAGVMAGLVQVAGVSRVDLQTGAQVMYYGGDAVDVALIALVLLAWYRAAGRRRTAGSKPKQRQHSVLAGGQGVLARQGGSA